MVKGGWNKIYPYKIKIMNTLYIFSGWPWKEHEVSISSWKNITSQIVNNGKYVVHNVIVEGNREYLLDSKILTQEEVFEDIDTKSGIVFPIIHGTFGEDGELASLLEKAKISFIWSSSDILKLTIDKQKTGDFLSHYNIRVPKSFVIQRIWQINELNIAFPCIVKPNTEWSSVSLYKPKSKDELQEICENELSIRNEILVQEYVQGRELTCWVIEINGNTIPLPPSEIILTKGDIFDYSAKYSLNWCQEITPANIDDGLRQQIQDLALQVHTLCGCKDISRTDMILNERGELVVLEINTIPGMTETSFIPQQLHAAGLSIKDFVGSMVKKYKR